MIFWYYIQSIYIYFFLHYFIGHSPFSRHFKKTVRLKESWNLERGDMVGVFLFGSLHACCTGELSSSIPSSCRPPGRPENLKMNMSPTLKRTFHRMFQVSNTRPLQEETSKDIFRPRCFGVAFALLHWLYWLTSSEKTLEDLPWVFLGPCYV